MDCWKYTVWFDCFPVQMNMFIISGFPSQCLIAGGEVKKGWNATPISIISASLSIKSPISASVFKVQIGPFPNPKRNGNVRFAEPQDDVGNGSKLVPKNWFPENLLVWGPNDC